MLLPVLIGAQGHRYDARFKRLLVDFKFGVMEGIVGPVGKANTQAEHRTRGLIGLDGKIFSPE